MADKDSVMDAVGDALYGRPNSLVDACVETDPNEGYASVLSAIVKTRRAYYGDGKGGGDDS